MKIKLDEGAYTPTRAHDTDAGLKLEKNVVEFCPQCETEIEMRWDVSTLGYKAFCPVCGNRLMLCDECRHNGPDGGPVGPCDYDSERDSCRFNRPGEECGDIAVAIRDVQDMIDVLDVGGSAYVYRHNGGRERLCNVLSCLKEKVQKCPLG